ncbi:hypothetical protein A2852_01945 [Candidatus Adlerbacteria bacterium RIFCSPHIGHO2_01_FULL_54_23]|uniref:Aspartyl/glutamyl-tRNA(Asn/Gln) amidotransferase subunit C n=3 Tax=Candidatus Adleribacteriota TaxID=1752736 RepID=A0A1F4XZ93_9BACT|nr:MAG: Aspartyl/glutamyl-tRNA(Asn/Gln) amidotransferase subunit C [Candidatus Adlerbacteria bacterium GW2011_GWA1_54_10]KKW36125.1 MAG: Aspartyl/glutamyl-tRNA(Asn/Gln) amidotransferase subunit C [Candidatus Adlerbacteria bacterium GW2011_GWA2_54_12]KKW37421.1 MAG: Aspartyl/glutamyl-tRNA(Asn/Gln) amidotransferase subunit C [Candidatus Adlerbacteria bacterium GW2011_GWB1_54_7]OGC79091.1 MAG: hypothetical protein A2852_01945 [Candidatus Adlerbacteria bacterium RIFCSPHIGHO2_01_FULL_54_23]OGC87022.
MISREEIRNLAQLARLKLTEAEEENLQKDISSILDYVGQISAVSGQGSKQGETLLSDSKVSPCLLKNVMREDVLYENTPISGKREALLAALPKRYGDFAVVRKVIQKDAE